jgi:hypothetical protein
MTAGKEPTAQQENIPENGSAEYMFEILGAL